MTVPLRDRKTVVSQIMTTVRVRAQLETLARREKVSVGEIGRRRLQEFLEKGVAKNGEADGEG